MLQHCTGLLLLLTSPLLSIIVHEYTTRKANTSTSTQGTYCIDLRIHRLPTVPVLLQLGNVKMIKKHFECPRAKFRSDISHQIVSSSLPNSRLCPPPLPLPQERRVSIYQF